jgi:DNA-directed RNA polymerase specialized sigma24 family protein
MGSCPLCTIRLPESPDRITIDQDTYTRMNSESERRQRFETIAHEVLEPLRRYLGRRTERDRAEDVLADVMLTVWR